jgi:hypothetical protein
MESPKCPWCGTPMEYRTDPWHHNAVTGEYKRLACFNQSCPVEPYMWKSYPTEGECISAWNTRVDVVPTIPISRLDEWLQRRSQFVEELYTPIDITMDWEGASVITNEYADGVLGTLQDLINLLNEEGKP